MDGGYDLATHVDALRHRSHALGSSAETETTWFPVTRTSLLGAFQARIRRRNSDMYLRIWLYL